MAEIRNRSHTCGGVVERETISVVDDWRVSVVALTRAAPQPNAATHVTALVAQNALATYKMQDCYANAPNGIYNSEQIYII